MRVPFLGLLLCAPLACQTTAPQDATPSREWTILLYGAVDNDWERDFMRDIRGIRRGLTGARDTEVLLLIDRSPKYSKDAQALGEDFADTRLYRMTNGGAERRTPGFDCRSNDILARRIS